MQDPRFQEIKDFYWHSNTRAQFYPNEKKEYKTHMYQQHSENPSLEATTYGTWLQVFGFRINTREQFLRCLICNILFGLSVMIYTEHMYKHIYVWYINIAHTGTNAESFTAGHDGDTITGYSLKMLFPQWQLVSCDHFCTRAFSLFVIGGMSSLG